MTARSTISPPGAMKSAGAEPPQIMGPTAISGFRGYIYDSSMVNGAGVHVNVHMVAVKTDSNHMASLTLLTVDGIGGQDYAAAQTVLENVAIVGP
ncbi:MAG: hypothetical protein WDM81_15055 [Rhizomicrobium sp.]